MNKSLYYIILYSHCTNIRTKGREHNFSFSSMLEDGLQDLVQEEIDLHGILVLVLAVPHQLAILQLNIEATALVQLAQHRL